ncbi:hypothetical protein [Sphingomonas sp.]|uniref:hypothetical protein n=1 Tax=Sphingomonas sp. TaxID=28214 RepID=UPI0025CF49C8|nr:hypothetical protein [Sphingomonas sp.]MBV9528718.1 hypothetical protein [Sphingomonas sp.]
MSSVWSFVAKPKNRQVLSWLGSGLVALAVGAWAVVTYIWPAHDDGAKCVSAQQGSVAAGHDVRGATITYNGGAPTGVGNSGTVASCADTAKK